MHNVLMITLPLTRKMQRYTQTIQSDPILGESALVAPRLGTGRQDTGTDRSRQAHRRDLQSAPVQSDSGGGTGGGDLGRPECETS